MYFTNLLSEAGVEAQIRHGDAEIEDVCADSRRSGPKSCFVAVRGDSADGHDYLSALGSRVGAVVCEDPAAVPAGIPYAVVENARRSLGLLAHALHGWPSRKLKTVGVTGTNGKTTVVYIIRSILAGSGHTPGMLGTVEYDTGRGTSQSTMTTPDGPAIAGMCSAMVQHGATHLVMEVSSHGLAQFRTAGLDFDVGVFTNIAGDHLDYHGDMETYLEMKTRLFRSLRPDATAVLNRDDRVAGEIAAATNAQQRWFGLSPAADMQGRIEHIDGDGTVFSLISGGHMTKVRTPLIGRHNVYNCLAAVSACESLGIPVEEAAARLESIPPVVGRLEKVETDMGFRVYVDYAHTDDALANTIGAIRPIIEGRIIVVFGCGGDRDRSKRPRMAAVAEDLADVVIITTDNPRGEDPDSIIEEILAGLNNRGSDTVMVRPDRREAIRTAVDIAEASDCVLIAGKGHETEQIIGDTRVYFSDVEEAAGAIADRKDAT